MCVLQVAMHCILWALAECSDRGWVLNDIRLANIVKLETGHWCLIDCEFARRAGDSFPAELATKCDWTSECSPASDLCVLFTLKWAG